MLIKNLLLWITVAVSCSSSSAIASEQDTQAGMRPGVRYTTGSYRIAGWEKQLVGGDKNLQHWNWSPMVGYTQSTSSMPTGKQAAEAPMPLRKSCYTKPIHVPFPVAHYSAPPTHTVAKRPDVKIAEYRRPTVSLSYTSSYPSSYQGRENLIAHTNLSGVLVHQGVQAVLQNNSTARY
jgi:hypothetical protein